MIKRRSKIYISEDLLIETLSRVPAKSLARLRSTSKRWNLLVKDGRFAKKHSVNAPMHSSLLLMLNDFRVYLVSLDLHGNVTPSAKVTSQFSLKDPLSEQVDIHKTYRTLSPKSMSLFLIRGKVLVRIATFGYHGEGVVVMEYMSRKIFTGLGLAELSRHMILSY
ncbi:putative F-box protein [Cardamine amara subsp. amara]|uniref:F-box protein n=1 Tax=Cardamine amara subsp. amara TaxID=228776 RepID=A0ABD1A8W3_CARAN